MSLIGIYKMQGAKLLQNGDDVGNVYLYHLPVDGWPELQFNNRFRALQLGDEDHPFATNAKIATQDGIYCLLKMQKVWSWGLNDNGRLGDGTATDRHEPVQVLGGHIFSCIAGGGSHSLAVDTSGQAWAWGSNGNGRLGDGTTTHRHEPVQVLGGHNFVDVSAGGIHSHALL